ncbi:hypothetical protein B5807_09593 [Epicoccum nigrum]|uniref:C2H2-type domain-containing protein n=1 Tax=Epicoccum nigrum TaxID=105696 RepID=A0A1Y2LQ91_EPING|nr:hypothetical protein B5807_09593 [Epicoccum nigrum]
MSSNNYGYNYQYGQQSSAQQYPSYQTAPLQNISAQSSRQYPPAPSATANQTADYLSYSRPSYGASSTGFDSAQDNSWSARSCNYGVTRDNGSRAAEVLHNMSNTSYSSTTAAPSQPGFATTTASSAHYASGRSPQMQAQPVQASHSTYGQSQARARSVNTTNHAQASSSKGLPSPATVAGHTSQRASSQYNQQQAQQRTASPAQPQYQQNNAANSNKNTAVAAAGTSQQYTDYTQRQRPDVEAARTSHSVSASNSYTPRPPAPIVPPPASKMADSYPDPTTTVDPTAVYDPWPEYQRQKAIRDAERAERERKEEEARKEKEWIEEEEKQKEASPQAQIAEEQRAKQPQAPAAATAPAEPSDGSAGANALELEIRAMMAKMRELNGKDPQLLARIWEEERRAKAPSNKSPVQTAKLAPQLAVVLPAQVPTPPIANQRKRAAPRESVSTPRATSSIPAIAQMNMARAPTATPARAKGNTIWPPEKKLELAKAAAHYIVTQNPDRTLTHHQVLLMLDGNPSYVELCEQLEQMHFKLDRSVFAKSLLLAVPDVNSASRKTSQPFSSPAAPKAPAPPAVMKRPAPPAVMKNPIATPGAPTSRYAPASASPMHRSPYPQFSDNDAMAASPAAAVAETIPIRSDLKPPASKEEAARKRYMSDLVDLTQLDDDEDMGPPPKKQSVSSMYTYDSPNPHMQNVRMVDAAPVTNFPTASTPAPVLEETAPRTLTISPNELRYRAVVEPLDKKKALRRNTYNPATIARDVLLACGRHPSERQLNQHLDVLRVNIPQISYESDLSTIKWNLLDPGNPPPGYYKDSVQALTEDADDDSDSEDGDRAARQGSLSHMVLALPAATNPFIKQKRRGRPPRQSLPNTTTPFTPTKSNDVADMSASAPRPGSAAAGVGYAAFRSATEYGPDGKPLPKKKGRPVGWRKAIHGSSAAQQRPTLKGHTGKYTPQQSSALRSVGASEEPSHIVSRSPSVAKHATQYQTFKCKWHNCRAELHNLETLKLHVFKVHKKETSRNTLRCLWSDCGKEVASFDPMSNVSLERHTPHAFASENPWRQHIQQNHFDPLAWEQGDGPAGGLSDAHDSEACLSDAHGRRVTPRVVASRTVYDNDSLPAQLSASTPHGHGRPPKNTQEQEARDMQDRLVSQKRRIGGPGMDRGGATFVNEKRRRGFVENDVTEEELVDAEE